MLNVKFSNNGIGKKHFFKKIFIYFLIPILIIFISALFTYNYYRNLFQEEVETSYIKNLSTLSETMDNLLNELQFTTFLLSSDKNFYDVFYTDAKLDRLDNFKLKSVTDSLLKFRTTKELIDSVYMLHKGSNEVIDTLGTADSDSFYSKYSIYEKYNKDFWMNLKTNTNFYQILNPSLLENRTNDVVSSKKVIPFVTSNIESFKSKNLFVINISENEVSKLLNKYKSIPNSKLFVINHDGTLFSTTDSNIKETFTTNADFLAKVTQKNSNIFDYKFSNNKTLVISFSSNSTKYNNFIYVALVPYNDFYQKTIYLKRLAFLLMFSGIVLSIIIAFFMSKKIYSPIDNLINILNEDNVDSSVINIDEVGFLNNQIKKIISIEHSLKKNLSTVMPLASEQYIMKILTNSDFLMDEDIKNFINSNHLDFKYPCFCVSIIELNFSEKYFSLYNNDEYILVRKGFTKLLANIALDKYPVSVINLNKNRICALINVPESEKIENILEYIQNVTALFEYDKDLLVITTGIGRIYSDYIGLNLSFNEAQKALAALSPLSIDKIKVYTEINNTYTFHYSISDENKLYNFLFGNSGEEALSFLNLIIEKNYQNNPSEASIKKLYLSIYNTIIRVLGEKNLTPEKLMGTDFIDFTHDIDMLTPNEINKYVILLINKLLASTVKVSSKIDVTQITEYIKEHFTEDLYLESLAEVFKTSDKYLSRLFKESLGIGFQDYLASLRISKSKNLLLETNLSVTKIGEMVGFTTHSTFFRIFKKYEGVNPTQYRENNKKS